MATDDGEKYPSETDEDEDAAPGRTDEDAPSPAAAKANTLNRAIARSIDILFALLLARLPGYIGVLSGLTYIAIADGLMQGKSLGKRIIGLRVVALKDGRPGDFRDSILRNSTMAVLYLFLLVPLIGWALVALGLGFELLLVIGSAQGMRLGDEMAQTMVQDDTRR